MMFNEDYVRKLVQVVIDENLIAKEIVSVVPHSDSSSGYNTGSYTPMVANEWWFGSFTFTFKSILSAGTLSTAEGLLFLGLSGRTFYLENDKMHSTLSYQDQNYRVDNIDNVLIDEFALSVNATDELAWSFVGYKITLQAV